MSTGYLKVIVGSMFSGKTTEIINSITLNKTEQVCKQHICLPIYPLLELSDAKYISQVLINIINAN